VSERLVSINELTNKKKNTFSLEAIFHLAGAATGFFSQFFNLQLIANVGSRRHLNLVANSKLNHREIH